MWEQHHFCGLWRALEVSSMETAGLVSAQRCTWQQAPHKGLLHQHHGNMAQFHCVCRLLGGVIRLLPAALAK